MSMKALILSVAMLVVHAAGASAQRTVPAGPHTESCMITFNDERIRGYYLFIDARTKQEQERDSARGMLGGEVIVFFQGHAQRPSDAYGFTSKLAQMSKSGIVIIPVCDTPYGKEEALRGDAGKDVILMEMVRWVLASKGTRVKGYSPVSPHKVLIEDVHPGDPSEGISASLLSVGWSHGGLLARRFAHAYPGSVKGLAQICSAGYEHGSACRLTLRFMGESLRLSKLTVKGQAKDTLRSAWGFTRGFTGDFFRSVVSAGRDLKPGRMLRVCKDIQDCSAYCDGNSLRVGSLDHIVVIFSEQDTCMDVSRIMGNTCAKGITPQDEKMFWETFFRDDKGSTAERTLMVLPGTHLAPVTYSELYARTVLKHLDQMDEPKRE